MKMNRQFVNLVTHKWVDGLYSLRRIDPSHLFYRSAKEAVEAADEAAKRNDLFPEMQPLELPRSNMKFATNPIGGRYDLFALLSSRPTCEGRMVYANRIGAAVLYDADKQLISTMGSLNKPKGSNPVCLSIVHPGTGQDSLYVMGRYPGQAAGGCFEVLEYTPKFSEPSDLEATWRWRLLPPPPFVRNPGYKLSSVISYTTIFDSNSHSTIYVSCEGGIGTYSFETARRDSSHRLGWRQSEKWKQVGGWMLPFNGRAQYVPEFNLWFGFSASSPNNLCAADLSAMDTDGEPTVQQVWQDVNPPEGEVWLPTCLTLLNLGDGKFLTAKTFEAEATGQRFAVLTGLEIMHDVDDGKRLQMVKHKCAFYAFKNENETIYWVL